MAKQKWQKKGQPKQGIFAPQNPEKWIITETFDMSAPAIKYRSSWERMFLGWMDLNPAVIKANSEGMVIPYINPITNKQSRYYIDMTFETNKGDIFLVEIKPKAQCFLPKPPKRKTEKSIMNYQKAIDTYHINQAKWKATREICEAQGWSFKIITEDELGL